MNKYFFIITMLAGFIQSTLGTSSFEENPLPPVKVDIISPVTALGQSTDRTFGLRFKLNPGWKIYAPSPGKPNAFAAPPQVTRQGSINVQDMTVLWPTSRTYSLEGITFQAYEGEVILPLRIKIIDVQKPLKLVLELNYSVCSDICVPRHEIVTLNLNPGPAQRTQEAAYIESFMHSQSKDMSYAWMLLFAFLGGFILNFMPCVLPVLSLKIMSFAKQRPSGDLTPNFRPRFLATFAGILFSFILLGGIAALLDHLGAAVGWGSHFQQPTFLVFLIVITTVFSNSLWGFLDIELPYFVLDKLGRVLSPHPNHSLWAEDFMAGMLATLLATPCTAPFLGTALGYAFARSGLEILLFFIIMGLGFSLPYWAGALLPQKWIKVPKPGAWMLTLSRILGGVLALTTLWLLWVLSTSLSGIFVTCLGIGILGMSLLFYQSQKHPSLKKWNWLLVGAMLIASWFQECKLKSDFAQNSTLTSADWQVFDPEKIPEMIEQGQVVTVNFTAAWCLTCHVNKYFVLESVAGKKLLSQPKVVRMQADWTQRDPAIGQYLAKYQRAGIPFTIVFGPHAPQGIILPELLKIEDLEQAIDRAR